MIRFDPIESADRLPLGLSIVLIAVAVIGYRLLGLSVYFPIIYLIAPVLCFLLYLAALFYKMRILAECSLYFGISYITIISGVLLIYIGATFGLPFQDAYIEKFDHVLGFNWLSYAHYVAIRPWLYAILGLAYTSFSWQGLITIILFSVYGPRGRNAELCLAFLLSLIATLLISTISPTLGPSDVHGISTFQGQIINLLRNHNDTLLRAAGIVSFPSYHTVMAILFTLAHRGRPAIFASFAGLNFTALFAIPVCGDHYLSDMLAGAVIAIAALLTAQLLQRVCQLRSDGEKLLEPADAKMMH